MRLLRSPTETSSEPGASPSRAPGSLAPRSALSASLLGGLGAVLVPKCPVCFAAYGSALTALGLLPSVHPRVVEPLLAAAVVASFGLVLWLATRRRDLVTPLVSGAGALCVLSGRLVLAEPVLVLAGAALLVGAGLANAVLCRRADRALRAPSR